MAKLGRRLITGLAIVGVAYVLDPKRDRLRQALATRDLGRLREELRGHLDRLEQEYGPTARRITTAATFMPFLKWRWRVVASVLPQVAERVRSAVGPRAAGTPTNGRAALGHGADIDPAATI